MKCTKPLRQLAAVVETGSIQAAADLCSMSAPAMSRAIKALERETGLRLVVPDGRGIVVTDVARELADTAGALLERLEEVVGRGDSVDGASATPLRLATFEYCSTWLLDSVADASSTSGGLELVEAAPGAIESLLESRVVDLGLTHAPAPRPGIRYQAIDEPLVMGVYGCRGSFDRTALADLPFAAPAQPASRSAFGLRSLDGWPLPEHRRTVRYRVHMLESALALCRSDRAVAWLPQQLVDAHNRCVLPRRRLARLSLRGVPDDEVQRLFVASRSSDEVQPSWALATRLAKALTTPP